MKSRVSRVSRIPLLCWLAVPLIVAGAAVLAVADHHGGAAEGAVAGAVEGAAEGDAVAAAEDAMMPHPFLVERAVAVLTPTEGNAVTGEVMFEQIDADRVRITAEVSGLTPNAQHGFHIHEFGDISAADGTATGGHYNPQGHDHALPTGESARHAGDLGNLTADANGDASYGMIVENLSIAGAMNPILGRGVIVHAKPDDGGQPTGNAGARIAQGVIGVHQ